MTTTNNSPARRRQALSAMGRAYDHAESTGEAVILGLAHGSHVVWISYDRSKKGARDAALDAVGKKLGQSEGI